MSASATPSQWATLTTSDGTQSRVVSIRTLLSWKGVWLLDVDLDPDDASNVPSGQVVVQIGMATALTGSVDPRFSGRFASGIRLRVLAGAGGWSTPSTTNSWTNDAGVTSTQVYQSTAATVGETVNDPNPVTFGPYFERSAGPASVVFGDREWYVDLTGVTQVGPWPVSSPDPSLEVLSYDARTGRAEIACNTLVVPGTQLTDTRFDGSLTVRDVEQQFTRAGSRATVWFGQGSVGRLQAALTTLIREVSGSRWLTRYTYRFVSATGSGATQRLNLQLVQGDPNTPIDLPNLVSVPTFGAPGIWANLTPAQLVHVVFLEHDFKQPAMVAVDNGLPQSVDLDAASSVNLGRTGGTLAPVARLGDAVNVFFPPMIPVTGTVSGAPFAGVLTITQSAPGVITGGSPKVKSG